MKQKSSKIYYIHCRIANKQLLNDIDKIANHLTSWNKKTFTRSDVIRRAIEQYIQNQKADRKI